MQDAPGRGAPGKTTPSGTGAFSLRLVALACAVVLATAGCTWVREVSVSGTGVSSNGPGDGSRPAVSANGRYVVFGSSATNLVAGADGGLFVRDTAAGTTQVASVHSDGSYGDGFDPAVNANGRFVAFVSSDPTMVPGLNGNHDQLFVRDRLARTTSLVSMKSNGIAGNGDSAAPSISADGRYVAFESDASNLVSFDTNDSTDVFVRDLTTPTTVRVNVNPTPEEPFFGADSASISADGRYVAFASLDELTADETTSQDIFVRDRFTNTTKLVSRTAANGLSNGFSSAPRLSDNGRFAVFLSTATNLDGLADTNAAPDAFVRDLTAMTTTRVSRSSANGVPPMGSTTPSISGDGRLVAYASSAPNIVPGDTNGASDTFVFDRSTSTTVRVDTDQYGTAAPTGGVDPVLSGDGRYVTFLTQSALTPGHTGPFAQLHLRHVVMPTVTGATPSTIAPGITTNLIVAGTGFLAGATVLITGKGLTVGTVTRISEKLLVVSVAASPTAPRAPRDVYVSDVGTGPGAAAGAVGSCTGCVRVG